MEINYEIKDARMESQLKDLAGEFVARQSNRTSLLTVTRVTLSNDFSHVEIGLSVMPRSGEKGALAMLNRNEEDFFKVLKKRTRFHRIPHATFVADEGEYNRQMIEGVLPKNIPEHTEDAE